MTPTPSERRPDPAHPMAQLWQEAGAGVRSPGHLAGSAWVGPAGLVVMSELVLAQLPDRSGTGRQWLVSVSQDGHRPAGRPLRRALQAFGMADAEEDNHEPGIARKFWLVVDPAHRVDCECKADEEVIVEPDGYRWSNPRAARQDPSLCRGCAAARAIRSARPCSIHGKTPSGG